MCDSWIRPLSHASPVMCKLYPFTTHVLSQFSPWIIVLVAIERLVVVFVPHKAHLLLTRRRVATSIAITGCLLVAANLHFFWMLTYKERCANRWRNVYWQVRVFPIQNAVLSSFLPAAILVVSNVSILVKIARERRHVSVQRPMRRTGMTTMLVTASVIFVVTTVPVQIFYLIYRNLKHEVADITGNYVNLLVCVNYVINFLLYCISGSCFRREVIVMLTCRTGTANATLQTWRLLLWGAVFILKPCLEIICISNLIRYIIYISDSIRCISNLVYLEISPIQLEIYQNGPK